MSSEPAEKKSKMGVTLAYWDIRGLAEPIRYLLKYTGTEFEDVRYGPECRDDWSTVKETLGLDFPNLPYCIDGDLKITQSTAILSHLGRKNDLAGSTEAEMAMLGMLEGVVMDFRNGFVRLCYGPDMESKKEDYINTVQTPIKRFSDFLGTKPWITGDKITYIDFFLYELLNQHLMFKPSLFDGLDNLKAYMDRFEALPAIKEYLTSPEFKKWPVNGASAKWGGKKE